MFKITQVLRKYSSTVKDGVILLDWRAVSYCEKIVEDLENVCSDKEFINLIESILTGIVEKIDKIIFSQQEILLLIYNYDYNKDIISVFNGQFKIRKIDVPEFGEIEAAYLSFKLCDLVRLLNVIKLNNVEKQFINIIIELRNKLHKEATAIIKKAEAKNIEVELPHNVPIELINEIKKLGELEYFQIDIKKDEEPILVREKLYRITKIENRLIVRLPAYALVRLIYLLVKYQILPKIEIEMNAYLFTNMTKNYSLYPYQETAVKLWLNKDKFGTIVLPTGGGKTFIGIHAMASLRVPTIIFVPNKILLWQWRDRLVRLLGLKKEDIGLLGAGRVEIKWITVATYQSGIKYIDLISDRFMLAIFDEGHHVPARTFKETALYLFAPYRMALSATPKRHDKNEILLFKLAGAIVYEISYPQLVKMGVLAPLAVRKILVPLPSEILPIYKALKKEVENAKDPIARRTKLNKLIEIARDNPNKIKVIREIVKKHSGDKMFIFCGGIKFAEDVEKSIKDLTSTAVLTAKTSTYEEKRISEDFKEGKIECLILVKKGEEGLDIGDASVAIIAGGSKQVREFIQRVGRVLRGGPDKLAWVYEIVTINTIEEAISRARRARELVRGIEDFIMKNYGVRAFRLVRKLNLK